MENMPLTEQDKSRLRDCLTGKADVHEVLRQTIERHTQADKAMQSYKYSHDDCYPGTSVLQNKQGIRDAEALLLAERAIVSLKLLMLRVKPLRGSLGRHACVRKQQRASPSGLCFSPLGSREEIATRMEARRIDGKRHFHFLTRKTHSEKRRENFFCPGDGKQVAWLGAGTFHSETGALYGRVECAPSISRRQWPRRTGIFPAVVKKRRL